jgi:hypothetical protein
MGEEIQSTPLVAAMVQVKMMILFNPRKQRRRMGHTSGLYVRSISMILDISGGPWSMERSLPSVPLERVSGMLLVLSKLSLLPFL